jgi:integrase
VAAKGGIYQRGAFWLDFDRAAGGVPKNDWLYICWYDQAKGRIRRKSTRERDVRLASDALDRHYLAVHKPSAAEKETYSVSEALTDYWLEHGSQVSSTEAIRARLKLITRFMDVEANGGRLIDPFLPRQIDNEWINRFRKWAEADPIIARRKNEHGEWVESSRRKRSAATVEESVIQLKAALNFTAKRSGYSPDFEHKTRAQVTPTRNDRLSVVAIGELLDYTTRGSGRYAGHADRLLPLRRYIIAALTTLGRPDAIMDMSVASSRGQWHPDMRVFDLNPAGRLQTKKYRAAVPVTGLLSAWLDATDEWFVSGTKNVGSKAEPVWQQYRVGAIKSAWNTAREELKLPHGWGPKLLRHSAATLLANRRVPPTELKLLMGHEALQGSQKAYIIFAPDYLERSREVLEDITAELRAICPDALAPPAKQPLVP